MAAKVVKKREKCKKNTFIFHKTAPVIQTRAIQFMATSL